MLKPAMVEEMQLVRGLLKQLAVNLGKDKEYRSLDWVSVGITDFVSEDELHEIANRKIEHWSDEITVKTARFFERKSLRVRKDKEQNY